MACCGTTLTLSPPEMMSTVTVVCLAGSAKPPRASATRAASSAALRPLSGSSPEWAARPVKSMVRVAAPLRATRILSLGTPRSRLITRSLSLAMARVRSREPGEPISSLALSRMSIRAKSLKPMLLRPFKAQMAVTAPDLSSPAPGPK